MPEQLLFIVIVTYFFTKAQMPDKGWSTPLATD